MKLPPGLDSLNTDAIARVTRRTFSNVNSSAMMARHPEVPKVIPISFLLENYCSKLVFNFLRRG
jgi:hypothetical protein